MVSRWSLFAVKNWVWKAYSPGAKQPLLCGEHLLLALRFTLRIAYTPLVRAASPPLTHSSTPYASELPLSATRRARMGQTAFVSRTSGDQA